MEQFLPDQDKSSLWHSRAFPPSVSVSNNHAGICARIFMETFLKYYWEGLSVHCRSANKMWYNDSKCVRNVQKCRTSWMCWDQGWIRLCRELWRGKKQILILFLINKIKLKMSALCACWGELSIPAAPALPGKWDGEGTLENLEFGEEAPLNKMGDSRHFLYREQDSSVKLCCAELSNDAQVTPGGAFVCVLWRGDVLWVRRTWRRKAQRREELSSGRLVLTWV